jgi:hypothetical protein
MGSEGGARRRAAGKPMIATNLGDIEDEGRTGYPLPTILKYC